MPSPVAHVAAALAAAAAAPDGSPLRERRAWIVAAVASVAPDADLLLAATLPGGVAWHHGPTHTLLGAALIGVVLGLGARLRGAALAWVVVACVLHPLLDWELGEPGGSAAFGVPLFWPWTPTRYVSPLPVFRPFGIHEPGFLRHMWAPEALGPYLRELGFATIVLGYAMLARRWARRRAAAGRRSRRHPLP